MLRDRVGGVTVRAKDSVLPPEVTEASHQGDLARTEPDSLDHVVLSNIDDVHQDHEHHSKGLHPEIVKIIFWGQNSVRKFSSITLLIF